MATAPERSGRTAANAEAGGGSPPRLQTKFWRSLKTLALINALPILGLGYLAFGLWRGTLKIDPKVGNSQLIVIAFVFIACVVIALSSWLLVPTARWMRDYPAWHFRHRNRATWLLPMLAGAISWFVLMLIGISASLVSVYVIATGAWRLAQPYFAGHAG
jgi:hypothetical protein